MADPTYSLYGMIASVVREETKYLRHYIGQVISTADELGVGRILVTLPELGWDTPDKGAMCSPRQINSLSIPKIGSWVEVYFMGGDPGRPVYIGEVVEIPGTKPSQYSTPMSHVLFESQSRDYIKYDEALKTLVATITKMSVDSQSFEVEAPDVSIGRGATEFMVLGTALLSWLTTFINTVFNIHTHADPSSPPVPLGVAPTSILSTRAKVK